MQGIRLSPRRTSIASSAPPIARPSSLDTFTPALGRFRLEALQASARLLEGEHDFLSFAATDPDQTHRSLAEEEDPGEHDLNCGSPARAARKGTIRTVFSSAWEQRSAGAGDLLVYRVRGNGFLHHMVRNLVGTMIDVGRGQLALEEIPRILAARDRSEAGPTAPARGLFLHSVDYPPEDLSS